MADAGERAIQEQGTDANTRDASGRRYGGEQPEGLHAGKAPTPFIWFTVFVIFAGFGLGGAAIILDSLVLFIIGAAVVVIGGIASLAGGIMDMTE